MKKQNSILVVDDDFIIQKSITHILSDKYKIYIASDYDSALEQFFKNNIDLILLDINLSSSKSGLELLTEIRKYDEYIPVIMLSSYTDVEKVVEAMRKGANDYLSKLQDNLREELRIRVNNCIKLLLEKRSLQCVKQTLNRKYSIISKNKIINSLLKEIESVGEMNIYIEGETGVGKTPLARHANKVLSSEHGVERPFVRINCAGLSRERLHDELFGHKKGAYTGADSDKRGLVEIAKSGDLFLDEIADMDMECQAQLLVFLDSGEYRRLGETNSRYSNCRIISASNTNIKERIKAGFFRKDLYSRLSQVTLPVPPLRERKEDIKPIVDYYVEKFCGYKKEYSENILEIYLKHDWMEGNVRELKDAVLYMCQKSRFEPFISINHINPEYFVKNISEIITVDFACDCDCDWKEVVYSNGFNSYISTIEKKLLSELISEHKSVRSLATKINMNDVTLHRKLRKHNIFL